MGNRFHRWSKEDRDRYWSDRILALNFWGLNGGLFLMFSTGLVPMGLLQAWASYGVGSGSRAARTSTS
jgi:nitric oxide reductase large subunit